MFSGGEQHGQEYIGEQKIVKKFFKKVLPPRGYLVIFALLCKRVDCSEVPNLILFFALR